MEEAVRWFCATSIVTGFDTNPAEVHAGSDFTLTIHLKNTSKKTKVQNMLFELEAPTEGSDEQTSAPAFLPTSGSNSIYLDGIKADGTADISITLNAKANLLQKPYSINLSMKYEGSQATQIESLIDLYSGKTGRKVRIQANLKSASDH